MHYPTKLSNAAGTFKYSAASLGCTGVVFVALLLAAGLTLAPRAGFADAGGSIPVAPATIPAQFPPPPGALTLWYQRPAADGMNEALPIGNGRLGGLIYGQPGTERIALNEDSLWTGDGNPSGNYDTMGAYQSLANLLVHLPGHELAAPYQRSLNIQNAVAQTKYTVGGVTYTREYFASHPANVLVMRLTADRPGSYTGSIELDGAHSETTTATGDKLSFAGQFPNGIKYEAQAVVLDDGGSLKVTGSQIAFQGCSAITIVVGARTNYVMDYARNYIGEDPHVRLTSELQAAAARPYEELKAEHIRDYQTLFNRVHLELGQSDAATVALPTNQRKLVAAAGQDPQLESLLFQYGRYLLISCSRPGGLPANLQGLWDDSNNAAWHSDYHANINVQMCYWPAEVTNLSECQLPLFALVDSQIPAWRKTTEVTPDFELASGQPVRGWALRTSHNITGGMGWNWDKTASAWYCQHYWEHYAFTGDKNYLRTVAYPVIKETCEFWQDHLKTLPNGTLVVPNGWSPEHGPVEDGVSYNQEIVWDLFTNYIDASAALGIDQEYAAQIRSMRDKLVTPKIGRWGQLQEWMEDIDDPNDHHRHTSHLFGVYPGRQFSMDTTPLMMAAAKKSLIARTDTGDVREWSFAWRTALFARMNDGDDAHREFDQFFADRNSCLNLFGLHPPMQIDGDFGIAAGVSEMLLQSQSGQIVLLPALPSTWHQGSVTGLRARGAFEVDERWSNGALTAAAIHSLGGTTCTVRYGQTVTMLQIKPGQTVELNGLLQRV